MRHLTLREHRLTEAVELTPRQRDELAATAGVDVRVSPGRSGAYDLVPGSTVGTLVIDDLQVDLRPKVDLDRVLFLVSYALDPVRWPEQTVSAGARDTVVEAMAQLFLLACRRALRRGPLQGYRHREDALSTVRGRIRIEDQIRRRYGLIPPVEVAYDEFTVDIEENRLLHAAALRVARLPLRDRSLRDGLAGVLGILGDVPVVPYDPRRLPPITYTRLNRRYRPAIELAKLILRATSTELGDVGETAQAFLVNMNRVFERFLLVALREAMPAEHIAHERRLHLDEGARIPLKPDFTWLEAGRPVFVGDAKYKALADGEGKQPDLYQLLAYVVALGLPAGMLVYAAGEGEPGRHKVVDLGRTLHVVWIDVSGAPDAILASVQRLANHVRALTTSCHARPPTPQGTVREAGG